MKKLKFFIVLITVFIVAIIISLIASNSSEPELKTIKSKKELMSIYESDTSDFEEIIRFIICGPLSIINSRYNTISKSNLSYDFDIEDSITAESTTSSNFTKSSSNSSKEHSTTNIQVENVDEADITKTDGDYIYSISDNNVIITDVKDPASIKIASKIKSYDDFIPEDLILYNDKLIVISTLYKNYRKSNTSVNIYDISNKEKPHLLKNYVLNQKYYTSRCINGRLLVISSGYLRKENDDIDIYYSEDDVKKEIELSNIHYIDKLRSSYQTLMSSLDLDNIDKVNISSYLFNIENAYISENNIYLLDEDYDDNYYNNSNKIKLIFKNLFGLGGIPGFIYYLDNDYYDDYDYDYDYTQYTYIYKFNFLESNEIKFDKHTKVKGTTINQFSVDEYNDNLRLGLYSHDGSRVVVFDKNLKQLGETEYLSEGEKMYSTRFMGNKAYMVTYKNTDPLYVIDLSNPSSPKVLGKLKIPGYSTYLHPYDETHLIGIGMQTEERVNRNSSGRIISTSAVITGMKMALFDVSNVNKPIQISETIIGDSRTTSAILTNHKALLFSAEKGIIAIPVNNYSEDFEISESSDNISSLISSYTNYSKNYISEGYFVYNINLTDGFKLKGTITHDKKKSSKYSYYSNSKLLRGLWIENNLYTISEDMIKVNSLENLESICELNIKGVK